MNKRLYDHLVEITARMFGGSCLEFSPYAKRWLAAVPSRCLAAWGEDPTAFVEAVCAFSDEDHESLVGLEGSVADVLDMSTEEVQRAW